MEQETPTRLLLSPSLADGRIALDAVLLKRLRKARALSQEALAELCFNRQLAVSIASIKRAEAGKVVLYRTARHLAQFFDIELEQLMLAKPDGFAAPDADAPSQPGAAAAVAVAVVQAAAATPASAALAGPAADSAAAATRYVIELHIELAAALAPGDPMRASVAALLQQYGGSLDDGDGAQLLARFGLRQAYRSDAERSLRCAIELGRRLLAHGGRAMALRLVQWHAGAGANGIDHGANGAGDSAAAGRPDLRRADSAGATFRIPIYVAANLMAQLTARFEFDRGAPRYPGYLAYRRPAAADAAPATALIGRHAETGLFKALIAASRDGHGGHIVYLRAMAGVGKTRLAQECAELARQQGMRCHGAEVLDAGADSWRAPLAQLARRLFGLDSRDAAGADDQLIDSVMAELALPLEWRIFYRAVTAAPMGAADMALYAGMSHAVRDRGVAKALQLLILRLAEREPLLITIEDIHWGDAYLFEALGALLTLTRDAPVIWVLTSRLEHDPLETALRPHLFELALTVFDLAPLAPREAGLLAAQFDGLDAGYRRRCVERAQGNALFLTQLLASPEQELPDSLRHLIQSRLDHLTPEHRRALHLAAIIGNRFELELLRAALEQPDYEPQAAGRHCLVRPLGAGRYAFVHDLVMHCIVAAIAPDEQRRLHRIVAQHYRESEPALCAHHLYRAGDPNALEMMLGAIRAKLAGHQYEAALDLTAACHAADSTTLSSFALALLRADAIAGLGQLAPARDGYQHAMQLAGRPQDKIDAVVGLATTLNLLEQLDEEEQLLDATLPLALSINADAALGKLLYLKGNIYFPRGNYAQCRRHHEDAARHARSSGITDTEARALSGMGDSYYAQGRMQQAHDLFSACIAMCEQHRYVHLEASNRAALGSTALYLGQPGAALAGALASAATARQLGNRRAEVFARMTAGWVLVAGHQLDQAGEQVGAALELARAMGQSRFEPFLMESAARIAWQRGDRGGAERLIVAAVDLMERQQLQRFIGPWLLGTLALFSSDAGTRQRALLKGAASLTQDCLAHNGYRFYVSAAEVALLAGDLVAAEFYADQLAAYAATEPCAWIGHHVALIRQYARWRSTPGDAVRADLLALRGDADALGFQLATPRLRQALERL